MMKQRMFWMGLVLMLAPAAGYAVLPTPGEMDETRQWVAAHLNAETPDLPFSFVVDGKNSADVLKVWTHAYSIRALAGGAKEASHVYTDPVSGLSVRCAATIHADFPAVEWTLYFKNTGTSDTPILEDVQALNLPFTAEKAGTRYSLRYALGSHESVSDFAPRTDELAQPVHFAPYGGRSSDGVFPFFNVTEREDKGVVLGIGWTGQWAASFEQPKDGTVQVRAGMERTHLLLHPGEEIRTPAILLLFWSGGDAYHGNNLLRRLLLEHYTPKPGGKPVNPPVAASPHGVIGFEKTTEANMIEGINNVAEHQFPVDTWWIDAGWNGEGGNWARTVGTWTPSAQRFPRGLKPVADAAHAHGLRFLLWFEPERVMRGTWLFEQHRDWLLAPSDLPPELKYQENDGFFLLNLGHPEALAWVKRTLSNMISETGIDIYRQDFNMTPLYFWRNGEAPDRQGMNEIRHVMGLYELFDTLLREHPALLIDNCASGGRRIDFEIMRRALSLWRSDLCWDPLGEQGMNYGISLWYATSGVGAVALDPYSFRSGLGSNLSLALDYYHPSDMWERAAAMLRQWQALRPLAKADFYPLTPYNLGKNQWIAWQYDDPERGEGLVQAFRRDVCPEDTVTLLLHGLEPETRYVVSNLDENVSREVLGADLMTTGVAIKIPAAPGAALVHYKRSAVNGK